MAVDRASSEFSISSLSALAGLWIICQKLNAKLKSIVCVCVILPLYEMARVESDCLSVGRFVPLLPQSC